MTLQKELKTLVEIYAKFDEEKKCYVSQKELNKNALLQLDRDFIKLINQQLLAGGPSQESITKKYRILGLKFHPDRRSNFFPEVVWLEENLSLGQNDGICFKTLSSSYEKLTNPEKFKETKSADFNTSEGLRDWLEGLRKQSSTYTSRSFYDSLIGLFDQSSSFFDKTGRIKTKGTRVLIMSIPMILASYGALICAEELFALYAVYFILLKGGQFLAKSGSYDLQHIGKTLQEVSCLSAAVTTMIIARLLEMTFWASKQCLSITLDLGIYILGSIPSNPGSQNNSESTTDYKAKVCQDLILAREKPDLFLRINTPELQVICAPLAKSHNEKKEQLFLGFRMGDVKQKALNAFFQKIRVLDQLNDPLEEKLIDVQKALDQIKIKKDVYSKTTATAVDQAQLVLDLLQGKDSDNQEEEDTSENQLVVYNGSTV